MYQPLEKGFYQATKYGRWYKNTKIMAKFRHIISFICVKKLLKPIGPLVICLQKKLAEV